MHHHMHTATYAGRQVRTLGSVPCCTDRFAHPLTQDWSARILRKLRKLCYCENHRTILLTNLEIVFLYGAMQQAKPQQLICSGNVDVATLTTVVCFRRRLLDKAILYRSDRCAVVCNEVHASKNRGHGLYINSNAGVRECNTMVFIV